MSLQRAAGNRAVAASLGDPATRPVQRLGPLAPNLQNRVAELSLGGYVGHVWRTPTNRGRLVTVWVAPATAPADRSHFCHGHALDTYARFGYTPTSGEAMKTILQDEHVLVGHVDAVAAATVAAGHLVVWFDREGTILHSARITHVAATLAGRLDPNLTLLTSKNGANPIQNGVSITQIRAVYNQCPHVQVYA